MNLIYHKGCFSETITIKNGETPFIILANGHRSEILEQNLKDNFFNLQDILLNIFPKLNAYQISQLHSSLLPKYAEDYTIIQDPTISIVELRQDLNNLINSYEVEKDNKEGNSIFETFQMVIELLPSSTDYSHSCEQCGDTNYSLEVEIK